MFPSLRYTGFGSVLACMVGLQACGSTGDGDGQPDAGARERPDASFVVDCSAPQSLNQDIDADTTLPADCYRVSDEIHVKATLVIEPGAVLEFEAGTGLKITDGALSAVGSESQPIRLTSADAIIGDWKGLVIDSTSQDNELAYVVVEHGGQDSLGFNGNTSANLIVLEDARVAVTSSTFRDGSEYGVAVRPGAELLEFSDNDLVANEGPPMRLNSNQIGHIGAGNAFSIQAAAGNEYVELAENSSGSRFSTTERTQSWPAIDLPYRFFGAHFIDGAAAVVTIEAGAVLEFVGGAGLKVQDGALQALGTDAEPVTFTSALRTPGEWHGLVIESNSPDTKLDYAVAEYGGTSDLSFNGNNPASVVVREDARASVTNSTFRYSGEYGLLLRPGAELTDFSDNEFVANEGPPMRLNSNQIGDIGDGNVFGTDASAGNEYVELAENSSGSRFSTTENPQTWRALDIPYRFFGQHFVDDSDAIVTIEAGAVLEFDQTSGLRVDDGAVRAIGTEAAPVTFTAAVKSPGEWRGLVIASNHPDNEIDFAVAEYGGNGSLSFTGNASANLILTGGSRSIVTNSLFRHSSGFGVHNDGEMLGQDGVAISPDGGGNEYENNEDGPHNQ